MHGTNGVKLVVFGLSMTSSWGNGHATLWRALGRALSQRGSRLVFFERDVPYYAAHRDPWDEDWGELRLYERLSPAAARRELAGADVAMVTSFCPDGVLASRVVLDSAARCRVFYDLDAPVTLAALARGEHVPYLPLDGLADFDLVLSFTGGDALTELATKLGARRVAPLYGWVDADRYLPSAPCEAYRADLSYLGTYAADRAAGLRELFFEPARREPARRFVLGGAQYPEGFVRSSNVAYVRHVGPSRHASFFSSARLTLNVTRRVMAERGHCPSGRLFEAAACGAAMVSDRWDGLDDFFTPGEELLVATSADDIQEALALDDRALRRIGRAARERVLAEHTARHRLDELFALVAASSYGASRRGA